MSSIRTCGSGRSPRPRAGQKNADAKNYRANFSSRPRRRRPWSSNWKRSPAEKRQETLNAPVVKALNVGRQQGFVVAQVSTGLRAEAAKTSGLLQIDAGELPPDLRGTTWTFAYRYASVPFDLELALEEVQPRITVDSLVDARLQPEKLSIDLTAFYNIERAGVFKLELDVPEGFEVRNVAGRAVWRPRPVCRWQTMRPLKSSRTISKARKRTIWSSTSRARPSAARACGCNCSAICMMRTSSRPPARRAISTCPCRSRARLRWSIPRGG